MKPWRKVSLPRHTLSRSGWVKGTVTRSPSTVMSIGIKFSWYVSLCSKLHMLKKGWCMCWGDHIYSYNTTIHIIYISAIILINRSNKWPKHPNKHMRCPYGRGCASGGVWYLVFTHVCISGESYCSGVGNSGLCCCTSWLYLWWSLYTLYLHRHQPSGVSYQRWLRSLHCTSLDVALVEFIYIYILPCIYSNYIHISGESYHRQLRSLLLYLDVLLVEFIYLVYTITVITYIRWDWELP